MTIPAMTDSAQTQYVQWFADLAADNTSIASTTKELGAAEDAVELVLGPSVLPFASPTLAVPKSSQFASTSPMQVVEPPHQSAPITTGFWWRALIQHAFRTHYVEPQSIDPAYVGDNDLAGNLIATQLFEGLLVPAPDGGAPQVGLAVRYAMYDGYRRFVFTLRDDASFSNGRPITAHDVVYSWKRILTTAKDSPSASLFWGISGAKTYYQHTAGDFSAVGIRALDNHRLEIRLDHPNPVFPDTVTAPAFAVVPREAIERDGRSWTRPEHIVVSGAYMLAVHAVGERVVIQKRPEYWDARNVQVERGVFFHSDSETANDQWYELGKIDWAYLLPLHKLSALLKARAPDLTIGPKLCVYYYLLNVRMPPLNDARVRRAVAELIDREVLTRHLMGIPAPAAKRFIHHLFVDAGKTAPAMATIPFNPMEASRLLQEAGYGPNTRPVAIELKYETSEGHRLLAEFVQRNAGEHVNPPNGTDHPWFAITPHNQEKKVLLASAHSGEFQMLRYGACAETLDPIEFLRFFVQGNPENYTGYADAHFDALVAAAEEAVDLGERKRLIGAAEAKLIEDMPAIPIFDYTSVHRLMPDVRGIQPNALTRHHFKFIRFVQPEME